MLWVFLELNKEATTRVKDIEQIIFTLIIQLKEEATAQNIQIKAIEAEYIYPFLESMISKNRSSEFGHKMEKLCVASELDIKLDYIRIVEGQSTVFTNPKPQTMDLWVKSQTKNGRLNRGK